MLRPQCRLDSDAMGTEHWGVFFVNVFCDENTQSPPLSRKLPAQFCKSHRPQSNIIVRAMPVKTQSKQSWKYATHHVAKLHRTSTLATPSDLPPGANQMVLKVSIVGEISYDCDPRICRSLPQRRWTNLEQIMHCHSPQVQNSGGVWFAWYRAVAYCECCFDPSMVVWLRLTNKVEFSVCFGQWAAFWRLMKARIKSATTVEASHETHHRKFTCNLHLEHVHKKEKNSSKQHLVSCRFLMQHLIRANDAYLIREICTLDKIVVCDFGCEKDFFR